MSGGGGGVGGPTVSHEPGVKNEPLLIAAAAVLSCSFTNRDRELNQLIKDRQ